MVADEVIPAGVEARLNATTAGDQQHPDVAVQPGGAYVTVWESLGEDGSGYGVYGQRYDAGGAPIGAAFLVSETTASDQQRPSVATFDDGRFAIAWMGYAGGRWQVYARRYDASGTALAGEQTISGAADQHKFPRIAALGADTLGVAWQQIAADGSAFSISTARVQHSSGSDIGTSSAVATGATWVGDPDIASDSTGAFVVAWQGQDGSGNGVYVRAYDPGAAPRGVAFQPHDSPAGDQTEPAVALDRRTGTFVVTWTDGTSLAASDAVARRYDAGGTAQGAAFRVNTTTTGTQRAARPAVAAASGTDPAGFTVVWDSYDQDGSFAGVYAQAYDAAGATLDGEVQVAQTTDAFQQHAALAQPDAASPLVVVWQSGRRVESGAAADAFDVFGRRFNASFATLVAAAGADRSVEPGTTTQLGGMPTAMGGSGGYTYAWQPAASLDDATIANPTATPPGGGAPQTTQYTLLVTDGAGRTARDTVDVTSDPALPVELVAFDAEQHESGIVVSWQTASERNNDGFDVQVRALDAEWQSAGWVEGAGTTGETQDYTFAVSGLEAGAYRFRLRQVDLDGAEMIGPEAALHVELTTPFALVGPYPNPARGAVRMRLAVQRAQNVVVALYDAQGRHVGDLFDGPLDANQSRTLTLDTDRMSSGVYFLRIQGETFAETRTLPIVR